MDTLYFFSNSIARAAKEDDRFLTRAGEQAFYSRYKSNHGGRVLISAVFAVWFVFTTIGAWPY